MSAFESDLIERVRSGDTRAFRSLVEVYQRMTYSIAFRMLHHREEAEDIVQEAFIKCWKNIHRFDMRVKFSTWIYRITMNLCLDVIKSSRYKKRRAEYELPETYQVSDSATPESMMDNRELMALIWSKADELTPRQKAVFVLRDLEDLSVQEVSEVLSLSPENVKSNLYYARKKMSEWITKMELR